MFRTREENNDKKRRISKGESIIPRIDSLRTDEERGSEKKLS